MHTPKNDDLAKEKQRIEDEQELHAEEIIEIDEAAQSAEGLTNRDDGMTDGVEEDRESTQDTEIDVPESEIIK
ncbi:MAG: hypothetical protein KBB54_03995 [Candidatus Pacebacteria bacterium]|nr:hypothetical protein [Candidatus Paceibacterota bacterium]MBP9700901.1 hypothetical protein [Candidatus Paceibacterota bacterium]